MRYCIVLIFMETLALQYASKTPSIGTFFEEIHTSKTNKLRRGPAHSIPHRYFHACSINSKCNFVVENSWNQVMLYNKRSEILTEKKLLGIWMKKIRYEFKVFTEPRTWHEARKICQLHYGDLASILSKLEENNVQKLISDFTGHKWFWLGLNDIKSEDTYVWSDGSERTYTNWDDNEPNGRTGENCMLTERSLAWYDAPCDWTEYFVCKIPLV